MSNLNPRIERLKAMLDLEEKRSALQQQLDAVQAELSSLKDQLFDDGPVVASSVSTSSPVTRAPRSKGRSQRGALKEQVLAALQGAGSAGVRVTELAAALGTKPANIHAWFHSTGRRVPGIVKVSGGHYRFDAGSAEPTKTKEKGAKGRPAKVRFSSARRGAKRGELSNNIIEALTEAGSEGLSIKDLSAKIGAKYRNVSVWFVTTGKKFPKLKKTGPGHYKLNS